MAFGESLQALTTRRAARQWGRYNLSVATLQRLTALIERDGDGFVALCPQYDIGSQGDTVQEARANLTEAPTLFFETADASEIDRRFHPGVPRAAFEHTS